MKKLFEIKTFQTKTLSTIFGLFLFVMLVLGATNFIETSTNLKTKVSANGDNSSTPLNPGGGAFDLPQPSSTQPSTNTNNTSNTQTPTPTTSNTATSDNIVIDKKPESLPGGESDSILIKPGSPDVSSSNQVGSLTTSTQTNQNPVVLGSTIRSGGFKLVEVIFLLNGLVLIVFFYKKVYLKNQF